MMHFLVRRFIPGYEDTEDPSVRFAYGRLSGIVGIVLNLCLFAGKFICGLLSGAISIIADAFNNLSDAGSSIITLVGFRMAGRTRITPTVTDGLNTSRGLSYPL